MLDVPQKTEGGKCRDLEHKYLEKKWEKSNYTPTVSMFLLNPQQRHLLFYVTAPVKDATVLFSTAHF